MNDDNRYDAIALRSRTRRVRDLAFGLLLVAVAAFSIDAIRGAAANVDQASASAATSATTTATLSPASCTLEPAC